MNKLMTSAGKTAEKELTYVAPIPLRRGDALLTGTQERFFTKP